MTPSNNFFLMALRNLYDFASSTLDEKEVHREEIEVEKCKKLFFEAVPLHFMVKVCELLTQSVQMNINLLLLLVI